MFISNVIDIDDSNLTASNVPLDDAPTWTAGTYQVGDEVIYQNNVFKAATQTSDRPDVGIGKDPQAWVRMGFANKYRMFNEGIDSQTENVDLIDVTFTSDTPCTVLALLGVDAYEITVSVPSESYEETFSMVDAGVDNWWDYLFAPYETKRSLIIDLVHFAGESIRVQVKSFSQAVGEPSTGEVVKVGRVATGLLEDVARTSYTSRVGRESFSTRQRNPFGFWEIKKRRNVKTVGYVFNFDTAQLDYVESVFEKYVDVPALYIGNSAYEHLTCFGICESYSLTHATWGSSDGSAEVVEF